MTIHFSDVRYIKLGSSGRWNDVSLDAGELHFGFCDVPHKLASSLDREAIIDHQLAQGRAPRVAAEDAREILDFYGLPETCLWFTLARDHLWWTFAEAGVTWIGGDGTSHGYRKRRCITPWSKFDLAVVPMTLQSLSTVLIQVGAYRRTICRPRVPVRYLQRRLSGEANPVVTEAQAAQNALTDVLARAIAELHQTDFETLIDLLLSRSGRQRISALGGTQEFIDLAIEHPATGERAAVQVKSRAGQSVLNDYIERFDAAGSFARLFFACHSADTALVTDRPDVHVWQGTGLAASVTRFGLTDWVLAKIA